MGYNSEPTMTWGVNEPGIMLCSRVCQAASIW